MSPALAGRLSTTAPPRKPESWCYLLPLSKCSPESGAHPWGRGGITRGGGGGACLGRAQLCSASQSGCWSHGCFLLVKTHPPDTSISHFRKSERKIKAREGWGAGGGRRGQLSVVSGGREADQAPGVRAHPSSARAPAADGHRPPLCTSTASWTTRDTSPPSVRDPEAPARSTARSPWAGARLSPRGRPGHRRLIRAWGSEEPSGSGSLPSQSGPCPSHPRGPLWARQGPQAEKKELPQDTAPPAPRTWVSPLPEPLTLSLTFQLHTRASPPSPVLPGLPALLPLRSLRRGHPLSWAGSASQPPSPPWPQLPGKGEPVGSAWRERAAWTQRCGCEPPACTTTAGTRHSEQLRYSWGGRRIRP